MARNQTPTSIATPGPSVTAATLTPDTMLTTGQLAKLLPGSGTAGHMHRHTIRRWTSQGVMVNGRRVKLHVTRTIGGLRLIRWGDYLDMRDAVARARGEPTERERLVAEMETPAAYQRRVRKAREEMERVLEEARKGKVVAKVGGKAGGRRRAERTSGN
jgi:hypothetical protein